MLTLLIICSLLITVILVYYCLSFYKYYKSIKNIKCINGVALKLLTTEDPFHVLFNVFNQLPEIGGVWFGTNFCYFIQNPEYMKIVLNHPATQEKPSLFYRIGVKFLSYGLLTAPVEMWRAHRKILSPAFSQKNSIQFCSTINKKTHKIISSLLSQSGDFSTASVDFEQIITDGLYDLMTATHFLANNENALETRQNYGKMLHKICDLAINQVISVIYQFECVYKLTKNYILEKKLTNKLNKITADLIDKKLKEKLQSKDFTSTKKNTLVDILLNNYLENQLTRTMVLDHTKTFILAGTDTIASALSFFIQLLAMHPEIQEKAYQEIIEIVGDNNNEILSEHLPKLKYLTCVIKESLRVVAPAGLIARAIPTDIKLNDEITLAAGSIALLGILPMQRNNLYWSNALEFNPDRFCKTSDNEENFGYKFIPFSKGPRDCIGNRFGLLAMKIMCALMVKNLRFINDGYEKIEDIKVRMNVVTVPRDGFKFKWEKR